MAYLDNGGNQTSAAITAGSPEGHSSRAYGWRNGHDPKVLAALRVEAERRGKRSAPFAMQTILDIANTPGHKDQFKAAVELLNRSGLIVAQKIDVDHTHRDETSAGMIKEISNLARTLGLDATKLLGSAGVVIDAEFVEIPNDRDPQEADAPRRNESRPPAEEARAPRQLTYQDAPADESPGNRYTDDSGVDGGPDPSLDDWAWTPDR